MARDFKITHLGGGVYDLERGPDGDLVVVEGNEEVINHLTYRMHCWLGESVYDRSAGLPYIGAVFGGQPMEAIAGLFQVYILQTRGISSMLPISEIELDDEAVLTMAPTVFLEDGEDATIPVEVST
jgi:hypothetical protein